MNLKWWKIDESGLARPYTRVVFWFLCLVRRPLSNLINHKLKRNDFRKRSGLFVSKGFPFQYYFEKKCGTSLTLLPSVAIKTRWWAPKTKLIFSNSLLIALLKGPRFHSQDLVDVVNQLRETFKKTLRKGRMLKLGPV